MLRSNTRRHVGQEHTLLYYATQSVVRAQGGLEALPRVLRAANASRFVTYSITFSRGAEFCTFLHRCFLVEFGAMEREKVRCTFL